MSTKKFNIKIEYKDHQLQNLLDFTEKLQILIQLILKKERKACMIRFKMIKMRQNNYFTTLNKNWDKEILYMKKQEREAKIIKI